MHKYLWDIEYFGYRFWLLVIIGLFIVAPIINYFEEVEKEAYQYSKVTWGIVDYVYIGGGKSGEPYIDFHFYNDKNKLVKIEKGIFSKPFELERKCLHDRKIGDTVIIRYSTVNREYAKIINCYWNENTKKKYGFWR